MALQSANNLLAGDAYVAIRNNSAGYRAQAQNALTSVQSGPVNSDFIFRMLDQTSGATAALTQWKAVPGLDQFATDQGYPTTMSSDCTACITAAQAIVSWVTTNFPTSGGFMLAHTLNADGTRTPRSFTTAQTAGLATALSNFVATIA